MKKASFTYLLKLQAFILLIGSVLQPLGVATAESVQYKDGQYSLPYVVLKDGTNEVSVMENYVVPPAALEVKNGKNYVSITVKQSKEITGLKLTTADGALSEGTVTVTDAANNVRTIQFELGDLTTTHDGWVKIEWPELSYFNEYNVDLKFDASQIPLADPEPEQPAEPVLNDGQYTVDYTVMHATYEQDSSMKSYFSTPAVLTVDKGQKTVSFSVVKDSSTITEILVANDGTHYVPAATVSEDKVADTRVVSFAVDRVSAVLPGKVHIVLAARNYDMTHQIRFKFNLDSIKAVDGGTEENPSVPVPPVNEGGGGGTAPTATPLPTSTPDASLADGYYSIDYTILKNGTSETSMMDTYVLHPGTLIVSGGQKSLAITLTQSKEITGFTVESGSAAIIASDVAANTRTVKFPISGPGAKLNAWVKIDWPEFNYFNTYDVDIRVGSTVGGNIGNPAGSIATATATATPAPSASAAAGTPTPAATSTATASGGADAAASVNLSDVSGHWAQAAIQRAIDSGIVKGYDDNTFRPNNPVSRAEFAVLLSRALKLDSNAEANGGFSDQNSIPAWAAEGVAQVAVRKLINGYEDGSFRADRKITRMELAVIIVRAKGLIVDSSAVPSFSDVNDIAVWARPYVAAAETAGLISGKGGNRYAPADNATRAEAVSLLVKLLEQ